MILFEIFKAPVLNVQWGNKFDNVNSVIKIIALKIVSIRVVLLKCLITKF